MSSSALIPPDSDSTGPRPRNRRLISTGYPAATSTSTSLLASGTASPATSRGVSPIPAAHVGRGTSNGSSKLGSPGHGKGFLDGSWAPSWASVSAFLTGADTYGSDSDVTGSRSRSKTRKPLRRSRSGSSRNLQSTWGPTPPGSSRPRIEDVAAGALAHREAELRAMRTASVLESHEGVNGGLDVAGKFKRRTSDEYPRGGDQTQEPEEHLVYIHHVQPSDTYAGIILKYKCQEDAFRKANGLWSRDNIQIRKWLALPVDACDVRGRTTNGPSYYSHDVDHLAPTPLASQDDGRNADGFFASSSNGKSAGQSRLVEDEDKPWTHVRWVIIDSSTTAVEIARVARKTLGYFPPRRKKSLHTTSSLSTPRHSIDVPSASQSDPQIESPGSSTSRRQSTMAGRTVATAYGVSTSPSSRSRVGSGGDDLRPKWMQRPGGVGSLGRHVRAPGPDKDYFNAWAKKHIPGLNIESLPSMSVMGSETARFGFDHDAAGIVESPFESGRDATSVSRQGSGLDKAAAAVETWLRGAFAKRPGTPVMGPRLGRHQDEGLGDLIELEDTNSDDGRVPTAGLAGAGISVDSSSLRNSSPYRASGRSDGEGAVRGRLLPNSGLSHLTKGKKAD